MLIIIITSILIGFIFAPLGCMVLWKRYVYFGDGLAHATMLSGVLSIIMGIPIIYVGIISAIIFAYLVFKLKNKSDNNAAIGFISSSMISIALILSSIYSEKFNINNLLFGDIISATNNDIVILLVILLLVGIFFKKYYQDLIIIVLSQDIACSRKINTKIVEFLFLVILSFSVLSTIKIVGALLVTSVILIPAMIARVISKSPQEMIWLSMFFALLMNIIGIVLSFYFDLPFAPIIIVSGAIIYSALLLLQTLWRK